MYRCLAEGRRSIAGDCSTERLIIFAAKKRKLRKTIERCSVLCFSLTMRLFLCFLRFFAAGSRLSRLVFAYPIARNLPGLSGFIP